MQRTFCYVCGTKLQIRGEARWWCGGCEQDYYNNPKPAVEIALFNTDGQLLMALRGREPYKGKYDLPGGFVDLNETIEEAITREIEEELGVKPDQYSPLKYLSSYHADYPWGKETYRNIVMEFFAILNEGVDVIAEDDVEAVRWTNPDEINKEELSVPELWPVIEQAIAMYNSNK